MSVVERHEVCYDGGLPQGGAAKYISGRLRHPAHMRSKLKDFDLWESFEAEVVERFGIHEDEVQVQSTLVCSEAM